MIDNTGKKEKYTTVCTNNPERLMRYAPFGMFKNEELSRLSHWEVWCVWHNPVLETSSVEVTV